MFYDLNVQWSAQDHQLPRTLAFLQELGYNVVALNHTISGKLPTDLTNPIPSPLPHKDIPTKLTILRRITLILTDTHQNARLAALAKEYDILALRPVDERSFQQACGSLDCDIISLDLTQRLNFHFKYKTISEAIKAGKRIEICYSQALLGDVQGRRNLISNATQLIRASRGRGLLLCSEAKGPLGCRGPWDVINLATVWGLGQEKGFEGLSKEARSVVMAAKLKQTGWRGVVNVVHGGEKPTSVEKDADKKAFESNKKNDKPKQKQKQQKTPGQNKVVLGQKRKADAIGGPGSKVSDLGSSGTPAKQVKK